MHFSAPQSNLLAPPSPKIASIVKDLPIVIADVAPLGGLGLLPLLLPLEVRVCCLRAEYMNRGEGDDGALPVPRPRTGAGYC